MKSKHTIKKSLTYLSLLASFTAIYTGITEGPGFAIVGLEKLAGHELEEVIQNTESCPPLGMLGRCLGEKVFYDHNRNPKKLIYKCLSKQYESKTTAPNKNQF